MAAPSLGKTHMPCPLPLPLIPSHPLYCSASGASSCRETQPSEPPFIAMWPDTLPVPDVAGISWTNLMKTIKPSTNPRLTILDIFSFWELGQRSQSSLRLSQVKAMWGTSKSHNFQPVVNHDCVRRAQGLGESSECYQGFQIWCWGIRLISVQHSGAVV